MYKLFLLLLVIVSSATKAQHKVKIRVDSVPAKTFPDSLFIAGSFNNWNPHSTGYNLEVIRPSIYFGTDPKEKLRDAYSIDLNLPSGIHEFKITRGSWEKGETGAGGAGLDNRTIRVNSDTVINISVAGWADHFPKAPKKSSAGKNVKIIAQSFYMPQLERNRRVWIYLPASYDQSKKTYPVLYMHDGQNVFEDTTSYSGEWGVDEALDSLAKKYGEMIVVAVDNGGVKRMNEYSPYDMQKFGKGEGDAYVDFLVKTLKPFIQKQYRGSKKSSDNFIGGSSMGGLISLYAILKYPKEFGAAGVFSPAIWIAPAITNYTIKKAKDVKGKIYFYAGKKESDSMVPDMLKVFENMRKLSNAKMKTVIREEGKHNEATWRAEFPLFYRWLLEK